MSVGTKRIQGLPYMTRETFAILATFLAILGSSHAQSLPRYTIETVAGSGEPEFSGDGGPATEASINKPTSLAVYADGTLYIADSQNRRVRMVSPDGIISTVAGTGEARRQDNPRRGTKTNLSSLYGINADADGILYVANRGHAVVYRVSKRGKVTTVAGNGKRGAGIDGVPATETELQGTNDLAFDLKGRLLIADSGNHRVRRVNTDGVIETIAGTGTAGWSGDGGPAVAAQLAAPSPLAVGRDGSLYIADFSNHAIRKVDPDGVITTLVGKGEPGFSPDGTPAAEAYINEATGVSVDEDGVVYYSDSINHRIRAIAPDGTVQTVCGTGERAYSGDGGPATAAAIAVPDIIRFDADGNLYITDYQNHRVRKLTPIGTR